MNYLLHQSKSRKNAIIVIAIMITMVLSSTILAAAVSVDASTDSYWDIKLGNKVIATASNKSDAEQVVKDVKTYYLSEGATLLAAKCDPALTIEANDYKKATKQPKIMKDPKKVVEMLVKGKDAQKTYTIKDGDTVWDVAFKLGTSYDNIASLNKGINLEELVTGDKIVYEGSEPMVDVTLTEKKTSDEAIPYEIDQESTDSLYEGEQEIKVEGENGEQTVTTKTVKKNGVAQSTKELKSVTKKEPVNAVVLVGTKQKSTATASYGGGVATASTASIGNPPMSGNGAAVASYAAGFAGVTPYVWGGHSLTSGADCWGFVAAAYRACGYNIGYGQGMSVPFSSRQPGDIIVFNGGGHYAIYLGGNMVVHALNPREGTKVTSINYTGQTITGVRRVVG